MNFKSNSARGIFLAGLLLAASFAQAQESGRAASASTIVLTPDGLTAHYPSGSIQSTEIANKALAEVELQRAHLDQVYAAQQRVCYTKFLATSCLDAAKESHRLGMAQIRKVEVEANSFIRSARVVERDKNLAEKSAKNAGNPPKPLTDPSTHPVVKTDADAGEPRAAPKAPPKKRELDAQQQAANVAAYEKKVKDAEARQRDVAAKKADKARQAAAKAASAAASTPAPANP